MTTKPKSEWTREDWDRHFLEKRDKHDALALVTYVPEETEPEKYTNRRLEIQWVTKVEGMDEGSLLPEYVYVTGSWGMTAGLPTRKVPVPEVGDVYGLETTKGSIVTGWLIKGQWYARKTDDDLKADHESFVADLKRRRQEELEKNRTDYFKREAALPDWLQARMATFHKKGGESFRLDGWGYELVVAEIAALYDTYGIAAKHADEHEKIREYADKNGTTGNQHGMASALVRAHQRGESLSETVSALSPLTGNAFYEETK